MHQWMTERKAMAILMGAAMVALFLLILRGIFRERDRYYTLKVKNASARYRALLRLNRQAAFNTRILDEYTYEKWVNSKTQFDRFNFDQFLRAKIAEDMDGCERLIQAVRENRQLAQWYRQELERLPGEITARKAKEKGVPYRIFKKKEDELCAATMLRPVVSPQTRCVVYFRTPHGRNQYRDEMIYDFDAVIEQYQQVKQQMDIRSSAYGQRKMMTDSLRYDILKRDGFRCAICGRTAKDGVKLHVDHILPVSRGGKTEPENLRTLCSECNLGKRDKYDAYGWN